MSPEAKPTKTAEETAPAAPAKMSAEEIRELRRVHLEALDALPNPDADNPKPDAVPGTLIGEGAIKDKVAFTAEWYQNVEARRKDRDANNNLVWPNYTIEWFDALADQTVGINGVFFRVVGGRRCGLPSPHYDLYINSLRADARMREKWKAPDIRPTTPGSMVMPHRMNDDGFFHTPEEAAALDKASK